MAGFMDFKSGGIAVIGLFVSAALVLVGGGATVYKSIAGTTVQTSNEIVMKCTKCGKNVIYTREEFKQKTDARTEWFITSIEVEHPDTAAALRKMVDDPMSMMMAGGMMSLPNWGNPPYGLVCPDCGNENEPGTLFMAHKCKDCGEIFFLQQPDGSYSDKCPKCGYSRSEEKRKEKSAEREKQRERRKNRR